MKNIKKEAAQILTNWYSKVSYDYTGNVECTNHNELSLILGNPVFDDKDLIKEINRQGKHFIRENDIKLLDFLSHELQRDKELVLELVQVNGNNLHFANAQFTDDKKIVWEAVKANPESFYYASERLRDDDDIVNHILKYSPKQIGLTSDRFKKDKEIVIDLLKIDNRLISVVDENFKKDTDILLECWSSIKESAIYGGFGLHSSTCNLIDSMDEEIKPFFKQVNIDVDADNVELIKQMDVSFNHLSLKKELNPSLTNPIKKMKV